MAKGSFEEGRAPTLFAHHSLQARCIFQNFSMWRCTMSLDFSLLFTYCQFVLRLAAALPNRACFLDPTLIAIMLTRNLGDSKKGANLFKVRASLHLRYYKTTIEANGDARQDVPSATPLEKAKGTKSGPTCMGSLVERRDKWKASRTQTQIGTRLSYGRKIPW